MKLNELVSLPMKKTLLACAALAASTLGGSGVARATNTVTVGGNMGTQSFCSNSDSERIFGDIIVHTQTFTLAAGTWQPFLGAGTTWRIMGWNSSQYAGIAKIEILSVSVYGATSVVSSFTRSFDSSGSFSGLDDDQDFGSFVASNTLTTGGQEFILRETTNCWGGMGFSSQAHIFNTNVNLAQF